MRHGGAMFIHRFELMMDAIFFRDSLPSWYTLDIVLIYDFPHR